MSSSSKSYDQRNELILEIISTEFSYVEKLGAIIELLITPLRDAGNSIFDQNELQFQFGSWEMIYGIHKDLYSNMLREQQTNQLHNIPQILFEFSDYLRLYKNYVTNFETALYRRAFLMTTNKRYAALIDKIRNDPRCKLGVELMLIMPIQRISRYQSLLELLMKCYDKNDPGKIKQYNLIVITLHKIKLIVDEHGAAINLQENKRAIMEVMMRIESKSRINLLDNPDRKLIKSGSLKLLKKNNSKSEYMYWLFSDKIICAETKSFPLSIVASDSNPLYVLKYELLLSQTQPMDSYGFPYVEKNDSSFIIFSTSTTMVLYARSYEEKMEWLDSLSAATRYTKSVQEKAGVIVDSEPWYQPVWINDHALGQCQSCSCSFKLFATKSHCRGCGIVTCDPCCRRRVFIPHFDNKQEVNVCRGCYVRYMSQGYFKKYYKNNCDNLVQNNINQNFMEHKTNPPQKMKISIEKDIVQTPQTQRSNCCVKCTNEFSIIKKKQTCMNCGSSVCLECSRRKFMIPHVDATHESRVCNDCYFFLVSGASAIFEQNPSITYNAKNLQLLEEVETISSPAVSVPFTTNTSSFELDTFLKFKQDVHEDIQKNSFSKSNSYSFFANVKVDKSCTICSTEFTFFRKKQDCKCCSASVCSECNLRKCIVPSINPFSETQVCEACYFVNIGKQKLRSFTAPVNLTTQQSSSSRKQDFLVGNSIISPRSNKNSSDHKSQYDVSLRGRSKTNTETHPTITSRLYHFVVDSFKINRSPDEYSKNISTKSSSRRARTHESSLQKQHNQDDRLSTTFTHHAQRDTFMGINTMQNNLRNKKSQEKTLPTQMSTSLTRHTRPYIEPLPLEKYKISSLSVSSYNPSNTTTSHIMTKTVIPTTPRQNQTPRTVSITNRDFDVSSSSFNKVAVSLYSLDELPTPPKILPPQPPPVLDSNMETQYRVCSSRSHHQSFSNSDNTHDVGSNSSRYVPVSNYYSSNGNTNSTSYAIPNSARSKQLESFSSNVMSTSARSMTSYTPKIYEYPAALNREVSVRAW